MASDDQRSQLRERIGKAQQRLAQRTAEARTESDGGGIVEYAKRNPLVLLGGAAALGLALGALSRRGPKAASTTGLLGRLATDAAIAFAMAMIEKSSHRSSEDTPGQATD